MFPSSTTIHSLCPWSPGELRILPRTLVYFEKSLPKPISEPCITPFKFCLNNFQRANRIETYGLNYKWMCSHWRSYSQISYPLSLGTISMSGIYWWTWKYRDIECDRMKIVILGHFFPFTLLPENLKNQNFEKVKNTSGDIIILRMCTKNHNHMRYGSWDTEWDRQNFLSLWAILCLFTLQSTWKIKILKKWKKKAYRYHHFTLDYHRGQSYDVCFLRYGGWQTELFVFLDFFCPTTWKIKILNEKNTWRYYHFAHVYHKWKSYDVWLLRYGVWQTKFFLILDLFFPIYPTNSSKNQNFEKMKKKKKHTHTHVEISSFYTSVPKIMIICYTVPKIWHMTDVIVTFHFGLFLPFYSPNSPKNQN